MLDCPVRQYVMVSGEPVLWFISILCAGAILRVQWRQ